MADEIDMVTDAILEAPGIQADQIRASLQGESREYCEECGCEIPEARRAVINAIRCAPCQEIVDIREKGRAYR